MEGDQQYEREKPPKQTRHRQIISFTGAAGLLAVATVNLAIFVFFSRRRTQKKKDLPGSNVRMNLSADEIRKLADRIIAESKKVHDALASVPVDKVTHQNIMSLADLEARHFPLVQSCVFSKFVSVSEDVRKASIEAGKRINEHRSMCGKREDVYRVVKAFAGRGQWQNAEAKSYVQSLVTEFERNGLHLTLAKREEVQRLRAQIDELSIQFVQNLNSDCTFLLFSETQLDGLPSEFLQTLDRAENGNFKVTLRSTHVLPVLELCKVGITRRKVAVAHGQRCKEVNAPLLENLVQLRHKFSRLLGYENYADYVVSIRMAKSSSKVFEFLEDISTSLSDLAAKELAILQELKKKEEGDDPFGIEDLLYFVKQYEDQTVDLDFETLKQYFPLNLVLQGIFKILQDLMGLKFDEIADAEVWHHDVLAFSISESSSGRLLGYAFLDLYSRGGKYGHTCVVPLQNNSLLTDGSRQVPMVLLISEFQKSVGDHPVLLRFSEVVNLFHEFGHLVHHICNQATLTRFSGLCVDPDFVEIPGHVFENWCYDSFTLKMISGHYQDITRPIQEDVCASLRKRRYSFSALKLTQQILFCLFDQIIHSADNVDFLELFKYLHPKVMLGLPTLEGANPASCFPHSAIGHEASCYSRVWWKVFAADAFASKFHGGLLNQYVGMQFRTKVLGPGGAKDPTKCLSDYLGREPSIQPFIDMVTSSSML